MYLAVSPCISPPRTSVLSGGRDGTVCTTPLRGGAAPPSTLLCKGRGIVQRLLTLAVALIPTLTLALALTLTLTLTLTRHRAAAAIALRAARPSLGRLLRVHAYLLATSARRPRRARERPWLSTGVDAAQAGRSRGDLGEIHERSGGDLGET